MSCPEESANYLEQPWSSTDDSWTQGDSKEEEKEEPMNIDKNQCYNCLEEGHYVRNCNDLKRKRVNPRKDVICHLCGMQGHHALSCVKKRRSLESPDEEEPVRGSKVKLKACHFCDKTGHHHMVCRRKRRYRE